MGAPANNAGHGKDGGVQLTGNAYHLIDEAGVKIQVSAHGAAELVSLTDAGKPPLLNTLEEVKLLLKAFLRCQFASHLLQGDGAGVRQSVNCVAQAIDEAGLVVGLPTESNGGVRVGAIGPKLLQIYVGTVSDIDST